MEGENLNKPISRKSSSTENGKGKDIINDNGSGGGDVALKAKMSLLNGITVIVGSIIGRIYWTVSSSVRVIKILYDLINIQMSPRRER